MNNGNTSTEKKQVRLFDEQGCLTQEALLGYAFDKLFPQQNEEAVAHIQQCEICKDALEGVKLSGSYEQANDAINSLREKMDEKTGRQSAGGFAFDFSEYRKLAAVIIAGVLLSGFGFLIIQNFTSSNEKITQEKIPANDQLAELNKKKAEQKKEVKVEEPLTLEAEEVIPDTSSAALDNVETFEDETVETRLAKNEEGELKTIEKQNDKKSGEKKITEIQLPAVKDERVRSETPAAAKDEENDFANNDGNDGLIVEQRSLNAIETISPASGTVAKSKRKENDKSDITSSQSVYTAVDEMPAFPGGMTGLVSYIKQNLKYPEKAKKANIEGKVYLSFVIDAAGKVTNIKVEKPLFLELDKEALRVVSAMPNWIPGKQEGKAVAVKHFLPIQFVSSDFQ